MKWNTDAFFAIGKTHMVCQDYAKAGYQQHGLPYVVLSDGCSTSPDTDVGARILCSTAAFNMHWISGNECSFLDRESTILEASRQAAMALDLEPRCLDATLLAAYQTEAADGRVGVGVSLRGDGVVLARQRDGTAVVFSVDHEHNAPRYMSYDLDPERRDGYMKKYGDRSSLASHKIGEEGGSHKFFGNPTDWFFAAEEFDLVMLLSDGVHTFQRLVKTNTTRMLEPVPTDLVIEHLLKIRSATGKFLQRRCHKFLTTYCETNEWQHADDFSAAAIWMRGDDA